MGSLQNGKISTEADWVRRSQSGEIEAFNELVRCYRLPVIDVVYRMCGDAALAEDSAQEAFIRAWQHIPCLRPGSSFRNWLFRIAINVAKDALRQEKPTQDYDDMEQISDAYNPEAEHIQNSRLRQVRESVLSLPEASRAVVILREYQGLSYQEIADVLEIPKGTVMSRLSYARQLLAVRLASIQEAA